MIIDYLDEDVAYLLGLIVARGTIREAGVRQILVRFPFRGLKVIGIKKKIVQKKNIKVSLIDVSSRVGELTDSNVRLEEEKHAVLLIIESLKNTIFWRNIRTILGTGLSYTEFEVPTMIMNGIDEIKKEFLRGFADVAGSARYANRDEGGRCRIYIDVLNANWVLPVQICHLLQDLLKVPVRNITWGHPNIRDPNLVSYNEGKHGAWAREHQIRVYTENFIKIGFYMSHKQEILEELAEYNLREFGEYSSFCSPPKTKITRKPKHPEETSRKLPPPLRSKHYDAYWQICCDLGCARCAKQKKLIRKNQKKRKKGI